MEKTVVDSLRLVFIDTYALYLKTQSYHWNVVGPHFHSYHLLFEEQYKEMASAIDVLAERVRALGAKIPVSFDFFKEETQIKFGALPEDAPDMIKDLIKGHKIVVEHLNVLVEEAGLASDSATEDLAIERIAIHEKTLWMLNASVC
jgi:starvation-inducible DNA-binding protein